MSEKQNKSTELERAQTTNAPLEKPQNIKKQEGRGVKYANAIFINLCVFCALVFIGWYFWGQQYILAIEERLTLIERTKAANSSWSEIDIKKIQEEIALIHKKIDDINQKNTTLNSMSGLVRELEGHIQTLTLRVDGFEEKESRTKVIFSGPGSWQERIRHSVKGGLSLKEFQQDDKIPDDVRLLLSKLDEPVTYKEISEEWNKIRDLIRFKGFPASVLSKETEGWIANIKAFFKNIFRVQRLDKNNLTYEETFLRYIDKMLIEKNADGVLRGLALYEASLDQNSKDVLLPWMKKIEKFRQGEIILETVKKY